MKKLAMNKAVFLDRDGTLNVDHGYVYKLEDLVFIDGVIESLRQLQKAGFLLIIITNQSGIGRGMFSKENAISFNLHLIKKMKDEGVLINDIFMCSHSPDQNCDCRKPSPKMILEAIEQYKINPEKSFMLGDKNIDVESGKKAGVQSFLVDTEKSLSFWTNYILNL